MDDLTETLSKLLQLLYRAPGNDHAWSEFISQFSKSMGAEQGLFVHIDLHNQNTNLADTYNFEEEYIRSYEEYYQFLNPYIGLPLSARPKQGSYGLLSQLIPDKEVQRTEFYNDYVLPQNLTVCNAVLLTPFESDEVHTSIALHYNKNNQGDHIDKALTICKFIMPHLQNALRLQKKLHGLQAKLNTLNKTIDRTPFGLILLDAKLNTMEVNEPARQILLQNDGLEIRNRKIKTVLPAQTTKLYQLMDTVLTNRKGTPARFNNTFQVLRRSGRLPYELVITPILEGQDNPKLPDCAIAIFINDPDLINPSIDLVFFFFYDTATTETQVTIQLLNGSSSQEICDSLQIGRETFKSHLKSIFRKTNTHKQSELVSFILRSISLAQHQWTS